MGGLTFGGGYFGQYSQGGSVPLEVLLSDLNIIEATLTCETADRTMACALPERTTVFNGHERTVEFSG